MNPETTTQTQPAKERKPFRFYSKPIDGGPFNHKIRVAVAGEYDPTDCELKISVARCSTRDQFTRKKARLITDGRLKAGKFYKVLMMVDIDTKAFVEIAKEVVAEVQQKYSEKERNIPKGMVGFRHQ